MADRHSRANGVLAGFHNGFLHDKLSARLLFMDAETRRNTGLDPSMARKEESGVFAPKCRQGTVSDPVCCENWPVEFLPSSWSDLTTSEGP